MNEVWKDIVGYEGYYKISNYGNIKSCDRIRKCRIRTNIINIMKVRGKEMKPQINVKNGYCYIDLRKNGKKERKYVHRLVAEHFLENNFNYPCINHKDENRTNNIISNLEWCSYEYNSNYGTAIEKQKETKRLKRLKVYKK